MLRRFNHHVFADGHRPVFLVGGGGYGANTDRVANSHADLDDYLGHYRSLGLNYTRSFCVDPWSSRHPFNPDNHVNGLDLPGSAGACCLAGLSGALVYLWRPAQANSPPGPACPPAGATEDALQLVLPATTSEHGAGHGGRFLAARWFDPETGQWQPAARVAAGAGGTVSLHPPPFDSHLALRLETASRGLV